MNVDAFIDLLRQHAWVLAAAVAVHALVRLAKSGWMDRLPLVHRVPARWRPVLAVALGQVSAALETIATGVPWWEAMIRGLFASAFAIAGHDVVIEWLMRGRELGAPKDEVVP